MPIFGRFATGGKIHTYLTCVYGAISTPTKHSQKTNQTKSAKKGEQKNRQQFYSPFPHVLFFVAVHIIS